MGEINKQFAVVRENGRPSPNERQWVLLEHEVKNKIFAEARNDSVVRTEFLDRAEPFACTLGEKAGARFRKMFYDCAVDVQVAVDEGNFRFWLKAPDLPRPGPSSLWEAYRAADSIYGSRTALALSAREERRKFSGAMGRLMENVRGSDILFAERFSKMWRVEQLKEIYAERSKKLTKPLEDYAYHNLYHRYKDEWDKEYKHDGAQATWLILQELRRTEERLNQISEVINSPDLVFDIEHLIEEAAGVRTNYELAYRLYQEDQLKRAGKSDAQLKRKAEKEKKQRKLAEKPIRVPAFSTGGRTIINHLVLRRELTGRHGWLRMGDSTIPILRFRQWLDVALRDPVTNRRVRDLDPLEWVVFDDGVTVDDPRSMEAIHAIRLSCEHGLQFTVHFYDDTEHVDRQADPIVHKVELVQQKRSGVWRPEDIAKHRPVLVPVTV